MVAGNFGNTLRGGAVGMVTPTGSPLKLKPGTSPASPAVTAELFARAARCRPWPDRLNALKLLSEVVRTGAGRGACLASPKITALLGAHLQVRSLRARCVLQSVQCVCV